MGASHSHLGPSAAKRWVNCPGSVALCARAPKERPSEYAAEGTVAHTVAESVITGKDQLEVGSTVKQDGFDIEITQEMYDGAAEYQYAVEEARRYFSVLHPGKPPVEKLEGKVVASSMDPDKGEVWGRADYYTYRKGDKLFVIDYKYGRRAVDPTENEQCITYAIAVMDQEAGWVFKEVEISIVQPRDFSSGETIKRWVTTPDWLRKWRDEKAIPAVRETRKEGAALRAGSWCDESYCAARAVCPVLRKAAGDIAQSDFTVVPAPGKPLPVVELMTTEEQEKALQWRDTVNGFFKAVEAALQGKAEMGQRLNHWKLVEGRANRRWKNDKAVIGKWGEDAFEKKLMSPSALEKAAGLKPSDTADLWEKPEGRKTLAPMDDKREARKSSAQEDFAPVCPNCEIGLCRTHRKAKPQAKVWA